MNLDINNSNIVLAVSKKIAECSNLCAFCISHHNEVNPCNPRLDSAGFILLVSCGQSFISTSTFNGLYI